HKFKFSFLVFSIWPRPPCPEWLPTTPPRRASVRVYRPLPVFSFCRAAPCNRFSATPPPVFDSSESNSVRPEWLRFPLVASLLSPVPKSATWPRLVEAAEGLSLHSNPAPVLESGQAPASACPAWLSLATHVPAHRHREAQETCGRSFPFPERCP